MCHKFRRKKKHAQWGRRLPTEDAGGEIIPINYESQQSARA